MNDEQLERALDRMRQHLQVILANAQMLHDDSDLSDAERTDMLEDVLSATHEMTGVVNDLGDVAGARLPFKRNRVNRS